MPRLTLLTVVLVGLVVGGCDTAGPPRLLYSDDGQYLPPQQAAGLVPQIEPAIPDVPLPVGFKLLRDRGHVEVTGAGRSVHHVYQGRGKQAEAVGYFRQTLRRHGWQRVSPPFEEEDGSMRLAYSNGRERLDIHLVERIQRLTIDVRIEPADMARASPGR